MSEQVSYVYDEICINTVGLEGTGRTRYEFVRTTLNTGLKSLFASLSDSLISSTRITALEALPETKLISAFLADLTLGTEVRSLFSRGADILHKIAPVSEIPNGAMWVDLPAASGVNPANRIAHFFYRIGHKRELPDDKNVQERDARQRLVRDLVLLINLNKDALPGTLGHFSAAPNWLCTIAASPCCSPAAPPLDDPTTITNGFWSFEFAPGSAAAGVAAGGRTPHASTTAVAILDTSPVSTNASGNVVDTITTVTNLATMFPNNMLLRRVATEIILNDPISLPPTAFNQMIDYIWDQYVGKTAVDGNHGLFIAGIIHDIAPHAETHLIRGMHEGGVSDVRRFSAIMAQLPTQFPNRNLVVNMSVDFTVPPGIELIAKNFTVLYDALVAGGTLTLTDLITLLMSIGDLFATTLLFAIQDFTAGVQQGLDSLTNNTRILIVGAAGNDNGAPLHTTPSGARPDPRWPANDEQVLSVAATRGNATPTRYSNFGDLGTPDDGIATFGGDTIIDPMTGDPKLDTAVAVRGIGQMPDTITTAGTTIPGTATCWIYWAGTSFSTPVISALATNYWDANPHLTAQEVLTSVVIGLQDIGTIAALDCSAITATQTTWKDTWWP